MQQSPFSSTPSPDNSGSSPKRNRQSPHTLLTLGDSYTIGEGVPVYDSFPYQVVQLLRKAGLPFSAPEIVARTGWTTDELSEGIAQMQLLPTYDFVSLLIGVNNQYRGRPSSEYAGQFGELLRQAIQFAGGQPDRVVVLSIPDWGVSPFAATHLPDSAGRTREQVMREIDEYNRIAREITDGYGGTFIDITGFSRAVAQPSSDSSLTATADASSPAAARPSSDSSLTAADSSSPADAAFAADGLHPSGQQYRYWAERLADAVKAKLMQSDNTQDAAG